MDKTYIETLKDRLETIEKEREMILSLIALHGDVTAENKPIQNNQKIIPTSYSIRGRVVDFVIELIHSKGRQVNSKEILEYLDLKGVSLGNTKNKQTSLAAILSAETKKASARLRKIARGVFDLKH